MAFILDALESVCRLGPSRPLAFEGPEKHDAGSLVVVSPETQSGLDLLQVRTIYLFIILG